MVESITEGFNEFDCFVAHQENGHILQTALWSSIKSKWTYRAFVTRDTNGAIISGMGVLMRKFPVVKYSLAYAPRGPVYDMRFENSLQDLLTGVMRFCKAQNCCALICDPYIPANRSRFPDVVSQLGFRSYKSKSKFDLVQPQYVMTLDLRNKTADELLCGFHSKTRYNIRLAGRRGVDVSICDLSRLDDFYELMLTTGKRDHFKVRPKAYFKTLLTRLRDHARLYMAFYDGKPIAGTIAVQYGNKVSYMYGASADIHRNLMPNHLLQWEMIKWGLETHCAEYDFGGVAGDMEPTNPLYGLYQFKKGFGAELTEFVGEYRYDFKPLVYPALKMAQSLYVRLLNLLQNQSSGN